MENGSDAPSAPPVPATYDDPAVALRSQLYDLLRDPNRLAILRVLSSGQRTIPEIATAIGSTCTNLSYHIVRLNRAGLIEETPYHRTKICRLTHSGCAITGMDLMLDHLVTRLAAEAD